MLNLRDIADPDLFVENRLAGGVSVGQGLEGGESGPEILYRAFYGFDGIIFQVDQLTNLPEGIAEDEFTAFEGTENIGCGPEPASFDPFEKQRGAPGFVNTKMYSRHFQAGVYFFLDADEMAVLFQIEQTVFE